MGVIRHRLTRIHLWIGEALGLTHYRSCWGCCHCKEYGGDERDHIWCDVDYEEDGVLAITNPSEAVWCRAYEEGEWGHLLENRELHSQKCRRMDA
jgi:hypothetical protein